MPLSVTLTGPDEVECNISSGRFRARVNCEQGENFRICFRTQGGGGCRLVNEPDCMDRFATCEGGSFIHRRRLRFTCPVSPTPNDVTVVVTVTHLETGETASDSMTVSCVC